MKRGAVDKTAGLLSHALFAGVAIGGADVLLAWARGRDLFLSNAELRRFALAALASGASITLLVFLVGALALSWLQRGMAERDAPALERRVLLASFAVAWPLSSWSLVLLTEGRRVRDVPARELWCVLLGGAGAWFLALVVRHLRRVARSGDFSRRVLHASALGLLSVFALVVDALVLRRLYPAFHWSLAVCAWLSAAGALAVAPLPRLRPVAAHVLGALALLAAFAAPALLRVLSAAPNARFAVEEAAPLAGKLVRLYGAGAVVAVAAQPTPKKARAGAASHAGIDLRGQDILLVTVDALRADRLRAYGGNGVTPELDALAAESAVFARAYTPTPHTSYAMGSLLTGKYLRAVLSLPNAPSEHATLPRMLRRYGYRTAGFYPPAIFFVDQERFASLHEDHFGLEYVKEMFAPATVRVEQVSRYLDRAVPGHPVFVWVHLFEPHEPYEPPEAFRRGKRPVDLYDGEVAAADAAIGALVRSFRAKRPRSTVIVTADHGEEFGEHGGSYHGTSLYEEQVRIPLLWSSTGKVLPRTIDAPAELVDIAPTLLSALGVPRDARMRGDDLGALLAGAPSDAGAQLRAFASIDELHMWTDGRYKALCDTRAGQCRGYDLQTDPSEQRPVEADHPRLAVLRAELSELVASLPSVEAVAMDGGGGWPAALARARLGDPSVGPALLPLLGSERAAVRAEAVRAIAALGLGEARQVIATLRERDPEARVRDEAAVCALALGVLDAKDEVRAVLSRATHGELESIDLARRAARTLAEHGDSDGAVVLVDLASDPHAEEVDRVRALELLGTLRVVGAVPTLTNLLDEVRLRPAVVRALGAIGGRAAANAIARAFERERYLDARAAEALALVTLRDRRAVRLVVRFLGTESGVPSGVQRLLDAGALARPSPLGADLRRPDGAAAHGGEWLCDQVGCVPGLAAKLVLRGLRGPSRLWLRAHAEGAGQWLGVDGVRQELLPGDQELSVMLDAGPARREAQLSASAGVRLVAFAVAPVTEDIPPPAPEPYDAGVDSGSPAGEVEAVAEDLR